MKKIAIIAALTLAIGASMTAGTMARYTQNIGDIKSNITAKKFNAELELREKWNFDIMPGDIQTRRVTVNTSEVETLINLDFRTYGIDKDFFNALDKAGVKFILTANGDTVELKYDNGSDVLYGHYGVQPNVKKVDYEFTLDWTGGALGAGESDELTQLVQGQSFDFNVNIHATQN